MKPASTRVGNWTSSAASGVEWKPRRPTAASIENARDVRVTLLAEAARDYVAVRTLQRRLLITRENVRDENDSLGLTQARFRMGFAPELDVIQAKILLETTQAQVPELKSELAQTDHRISVLLGREPDALNARLSDMAPIPGIADPQQESPCGFPPACLRIFFGAVPIFAAPSARLRRPRRAWV